MTRAVVNVATTEYYRRGQARLVEAVAASPRAKAVSVRTWPSLPESWPTHADKPYGFKAYALKEASVDYPLLLWCDACIVPVRSLDPLWERIERDGYWFARNGYTNYEWTADSAYSDLFSPEWSCWNTNFELDGPRQVNRNIPHVVATAFGLNVQHPRGRFFLDEYYRLASETRAFCGPWINSNYPYAPAPDGARCAPCGPPDVRGHRHDQTAASVIAWRLGLQLTDPPEIFAYKGGETERTILVADGSYA